MMPAASFLPMFTARRKLGLCPHCNLVPGPHPSSLLYLDEALARQFTTAVRVGKKSKEAGKTIAEVGLRGINGELRLSPQLSPELIPIWWTVGWTVGKNLFALWQSCVLRVGCGS